MNLKAHASQIYRDYIPNIAVLFLFPVSCWSTFSGIRELMRSTSALGDAEGLFVSVALTMGIQITLLYAVSAVMRTTNRKRLLYFGIYCLTVFFSVLFGYSFYFRHLRADEFAKEVHQRESQRLLLEAEEHMAKFSATARSLNELAVYSELRSAQESEFGGTCGDNSLSGRGPRSKGRRSDAGIFSRYDQSIRDLETALQQDLEKLRDDIKRYQIANLSSHHHQLRTFYQKLRGRRSNADELLLEVNGYVSSRFPDGRYTIRDGEQDYLCPDSRLEYLAATIEHRRLPPLPEEPAQFEANDPKVVVNYAMNRMMSFIASSLPPYGNESQDPAAESAVIGSGSVRGQTMDARENLPLFLGLLVDALIFLAAFARISPAGAESSALERLGKLEDLPRHVRDRLRSQLARLLGCPAESSMFAAYSILKRYETRRFLGRSENYVVVPKTGAFLERYPEISRLQDLIRLLASLDLSACHTTHIQWLNLNAPVPQGLVEIRENEGEKVRREYLEIHKLDPRLMGDLLKEAFIADELSTSTGPPPREVVLEHGNEAPATG